MKKDKKLSQYDPGYKTAGSVIHDHNQKGLGWEDDVEQYRKSMEPEIIQRLYACAATAKNEDIYKDKDFYICLAIINDKVLRQPRILIWARRSCPTPVYDQSVWRFRHLSDSLEYLWTIPSMFLYYQLWNNRQLLLDDKEYKAITQTVCLMETGELLKWVKEQNGETSDVGLKITYN